MFPSSADHFVHFYNCYSILTRCSCQFCEQRSNGTSVPDSYNWLEPVVGNFASRLFGEFCLVAPNIKSMQSIQLCDTLCKLTIHCNPVCNASELLLSKCHTRLSNLPPLSSVLLLSVYTRRRNRTVRTRLTPFLSCKAAPPMHVGSSINISIFQYIVAALFITNG